MDVLNFETKRQIMTSFMKEVVFKDKAGEILQNGSTGLLVEHAIKYNNAKLSPEGSLLVYTGKYTGRAAEDKYIVFDKLTESTIDWSNNVRQLSNSTFDTLKGLIKEYWSQFPRMYYSHRNAGAVSENALSVELLTPSANHCLFFQHLLRHDEFTTCGMGDVKIYHAPTMQLDFNKYQLRSSAVIATNISTREVIIIGTSYAGEIKKSVFSILNYLLPEKKILPMHAGANQTPTGDVSVFFGLSGTGKTTLSTQEGRELIGDDEHGLNDKNIFNFEGGCYAKMYKITAESEPGIFAASNRFGAILENVVIDQFNRPDYFDKSLAENTRSSYPLEYIDAVSKSGVGIVPKQMFFLSADAFGVLPPVSKLSPEQAMYYFLSGYTARLAGTEVGLQEPKATFSACFGAPFMIRQAWEYADLLGAYLKAHPISVWLINTGWTGGKAGVGQRFPLNITRRIIDAIQSGELEKTNFNKERIFGLQVPEKINGVDSKYLLPQSSWSDSDAYLAQAQELAKMFHKNFEKFGVKAEGIKVGGPLFH